MKKKQVTKSFERVSGDLKQLGRERQRRRLLNFNFPFSFFLFVYLVRFFFILPEGV